MDRRRFLRMTGTGVLLPAFLANALAGTQDQDEGEPSPFERARAEAAREGKPLLVFVKPKQTDVASYGAAIGDLILHADPLLLADLALVVGTVADFAELKRAYPGKLRPEDVQGARMLLVETTGAPHDFISVRAELGERPVYGEPPQRIGAPATAKEWIRPLQDALRAALSGGPDTLERRARTAAAAIGETARKRAFEQLGAALDDADLAAVHRGAALLRRLAEGDGDEATQPRALLGRAARAAFFERSPKGGMWRDSGHGCGGSFIDEDGPVRMAIACGIGHVPAESRRFLEYYVSPFAR